LTPLSEVRAVCGNAARTDLRGGAAKFLHPRFPKCRSRSGGVWAGRERKRWAAPQSASPWRLCPWPLCCGPLRSAVAGGCHRSAGILPAGGGASRSRRRRGQDALPTAGVTPTLRQRSRGTGDWCDIPYFFSGTFAPCGRPRKTCEPDRAPTFHPSTSTMTNVIK